MPVSYLSLDALKRSVNLTSTDADVELRQVLEGATRTINDETHRTFQPYTATLYFDAIHSDYLTFPVDLLAITSLKTDDDGEGVYENTWTVNTDYILSPVNAAASKEPFWKIERARYNPTYSFPQSIQRGIQIVGLWGYWLDLVTLTPTTSEAIDLTETVIDVSASSPIEVLDTILIDSEQMYVTARDLVSATKTITVERAVNGTTAATHSTSAAIQRYRYPDRIVTTCRQLAARDFRLTDAPLGIDGIQSNQTAYVDRIYPQIRETYEHYRLTVFA